MAYDFKYIRTGTGELSGPSMIWQTEQALTQIGTYADEANTKADEALDTANTALNKANEAAEAAERAQNTADAAQAAANHAQETADAAQVAADNAQDTADEALETAQKGVADAAKAQAAADKAQATADAAQDAADAAQLTADNAQNAADKAQDAADAAQQTANDALNAASNSQGSANVAQDTADNALLVTQSTQQAFYEHVREYTPQIAKALGEFEADNTTVNFDNFTDSVKLYITSPDASITGPNGKVNSPFYLWNFTTDDRSSTAQFVYAANGLTYSRYGTIGQNDLVPGTDTYTLENNSKNAILTCNGVASGMTITKSGSLTNTWTASDTHNSYITGTWNIKGITNGTIDLNGVTIANLSDTGFYPTGQQQLQEDNTSFVIEDMTYSADDGLTIKVTVQWLNIDSQISWDSWKVDTPAVDTPAVDNVTIKYNSSNELQAKDVAIGGDLEDLASARGIFDTLTKGSVDCNTLTEQGVYAISLAGTVNGPGFSAKLIVFNGKNSKFTNQMALAAGAGTSGAVRVAYRAKNSEDIWSPWSEGILSGRIGDGITVNNGIISVPEYEGATASAAGTSGLVPPAAAGQANYVLCGDGEWRDRSGSAVDTHAVDNVTIKYNSSNELQAKDVAIGGDLEDLASARGQIGDNIRINTASDLNAYTKAGNWLFSDAAAGENFPNIGRGGELNCYVSTTAIFQFFTEFNNNRRYIRYGIPNSTWTNWIQFISVAQLGDGIRDTNGIISVPEYEGATASAAGTSGLVPPAAAGQQESFLTGGGEYKPALTKISDSVNLADSKTAASAKAVKTAYDRGTAGVTAAGEAKTTAENALTVANSKQPNLGFTPVQQGGGSGQDNSKIYIGHGTNGLKAQIGTTDLGYIVTTAAGTTKVANSASADRAQVAGSAETLAVTGWGNVKWRSTPYTVSPLYLWCLPTGGSDMQPCSPSVLSVFSTEVTPNVRVGNNGSVLPAGGTWRIMTSRNGVGTVMDLAGGSTVDTSGGVFMAIRVA